MAVFPNDYTREEFIHFLTQQENDSLKEKFQTLPETITFNGKEYTMAIRVIRFDIGFQNYIFNYECNNELLF